MSIRQTAIAVAIASALGLAGVATAQTANDSTQPGVSPTAPSAQPRPTPGVGAEEGTRSSPGMVERTPTREGMTGATTPNTATQGGGADQTPPAATTRHTEPRTAAAPVPGANSFTEGQARSRMSDAGFTDVQELRLDEQGIWRGRAMRNGQQTGVALDYQGNVVATQ